ncbi:hypothetical protein G7Z17_g3513 [Cylindrodendrum hubeiense]|uniref:Uncharacterized protein n=1 Tax=Cylindrodendrum hubeiense TaxID=595255 RepID=A0A9P5LI34_9HYPO|nr:hypothetical protein G7Z17_g3513 [Cylindrodendrum hubeiense]
MVGFGDAEDEEIHRSRELAALEYFAAYKEKFAENHFGRMVVPPRQKPEPFMVVAKRDDDDRYETDSDSDDDGIEIPRGRSMVTWADQASRARTAVRMPVRASRNNTIRYARNHPSGTTIGINPSRLTLAPSNTSSSISTGDNVPPPDLLVSVVHEDGNEGIELQGRPKRMVEFRGLDPTITLTQGNQLITCYGDAAPKSALGSVARVAFCNQPQGKAAKILEGVMSKEAAAKKQSGFVRVVEAIRNLLFH